VNQMNAAKAIACMISVRLMFIAMLSVGARRLRLVDDGQQRIAESEEHGEADTDDERRVDQAEQQKHLRLQLWHELGLPRGAFEEARAHDADADAGAERAEADHEADADAGIRLDQRQQLQFGVHGLSLSLRVNAFDDEGQCCSCAIAR
jgi:hypothetical protein